MVEEKNNLLIDVNEKPKPAQWALLSFQHVFAMFGATVLVPIITGFPVSVALFASGIGTLIYVLCTKGKVPVYLGSSFAYISAVLIAKEAMGGDWRGMLVAVATFIITALVSTKAKGFFKIIPFLVGIICGYLIALAVGIVDFQPVNDVLASGKIFSLPQFILPFKVGNFDTYQLYFGPETFALLPVAIVTISEHIGDHTVLGKVCGRNFLKDPGLDRTLMGDGIATAVSAFLGGPANTTYGENTGVIGMTKVASVYVTSGAAIIAICLSCINIVSALIETIPNPVLGGMSILLYGVIASNGLRVLIDNQVNFDKQRNLIIASAMLVIGLGGAVLPMGKLITLSGTALSAFVGVVLNLILPKED